MGSGDSQEVPEWPVDHTHVAGRWILTSAEASEAS